MTGPSATMVDAARRLAGTVGPGQEGELLAAAWLHDVGYSSKVLDTGFHPLDGARCLRRLGWPFPVVALVAHHSVAQLVADGIGLGRELREFRVEDSVVLDALTYADQTIDPIGRPVAIRRRLDDMIRRHGPESPNARVHAARAPALLAVADRVEARLRVSGARRAAGV
jgi:hypothetical protein